MKKYYFLQKNQYKTVINFMLEAIRVLMRLNMVWKGAGSSGGTVESTYIGRCGCGRGCGLKL